MLIYKYAYTGSRARKCVYVVSVLSVFHPIYL